MTECAKSSIFASFAFLLLVWTKIEACPSSCACKWKNGKQTVECNDKSLVSIPGGMDPGTQVLDFSGNSLDELHAEIFFKLDLINLQRIYLSRCRIRSIDDQTFKGLTNLVELDLSGNLLETVPTGAFLDCPSLMRLTLNANPIRTVKRASFSRLSLLNTLELNQCEISEIESGAFQGLHRLEWLRLDDNQLKNIGGNHVLPDNLRGVQLQSNPWECDCHLLDFRNWLENFTIPTSEEPKCTNPPKLQGRAIKSITIGDFACLPDVLPTTLYLEINEGKNISLMCNVHAIPEARISWWFQGQHLQNDTLISPGLRLLYYIEEGGEDKRSELFIYNTNADDNGTFICSAENSAGTVSSNYTIRIIVKEEPIVIIVSFPFEYILAAIIGACALFVIVIITIIVCVIKCRRNRKRLEKREKTKEVALQYQQNAIKQDNDAQQSESVVKQNISIAERQDMMFYTPPLVRTMSPVSVAANQIRSPISSLRRYQLEQNPDLINDTESGSRRRDGDGNIEDQDNSTTVQTEQMMHPSLVQLPISCMRGSRKLYSLHSWDAAGCSLDADGYPPDYGLPKIQQNTASVVQSNENFYRTLPYNRTAAKRQSAANPLSRYSREAEFLSRSSQPAPYEHYCPDVRYTADGYPARFNETLLIPSPPEGYKNEAPSSLPCTTNAAAAAAAATTTNWQCIPHQHQHHPHLQHQHSHPHPHSHSHIIHHPNNVAVAAVAAVAAASPNVDQSTKTIISKRCVGAQTEVEKTEPPNIELQQPPPPLPPPNEVLTESPDEGYEGEPTIVL